MDVKEDKKVLEKQVHCNVRRGGKDRSLLLFSRVRFFKDKTPNVFLGILVLIGILVFAGFFLKGSRIFCGKSDYTKNKDAKIEKIAINGKNNGSALGKNSTNSLSDRIFMTKINKDVGFGDGKNIIDSQYFLALENIVNEDLTGNERITALRKLGLNLKEKERHFLYSFLANNENTAFALWLKDEIMNKLERQIPRPAEYEQILAEIALDLSIDGDLRGYAVQHLRLAYGVEDADKQFVEKILWECLPERSSDVAGTALLALEEIFKEGKNGEIHEKVLHESFDLGLDNSAHLPSRLTALALLVQNPDFVKKMKSENVENLQKLVSEILSEKALQADSLYDAAFKLVAKKLNDLVLK